MKSFLHAPKKCRLGTLLSSARRGGSFYFRLSAVMLACGLSLSSGSAASLNWANASGGDFNTSTNWSPNGAPGSGDTVSFGIATSGAVTSTQNDTVNTMYINKALTLDFGGHTLAVTSGSISLSNTAATFQNGTYTFGSAFYIDSVASSQATLYLTGSTAVMTNSTTTFIGNATAGSNVQFIVQNGASFTNSSGNFNIGGKATNNVQGLFEVTGSGSSANLGTSTVYVGQSTAQTGVSGTLKVLNGAHLTGGSGGYLIGNGSGVTGAVLVDGTGSSLSTTSAIYVAGNGVAGSGTASVQTSNGGTITSTGNYYNYKNATTYVGSGSKITANIFFNGATATETTASLRGSGQIVAPSIYMYGNVRPGDTLSSTGVGTLTLGSSTQSTDVRMYQTASNSIFDFNSASLYDKISIYGGMSVRGLGASLGTLTLDFNYAPTLADTFTIVTTTSGFGGGTFTNVVWGGYATGGTITYNANSIVISNVIATVPEPSSVALVVGGMGLFAVLIGRNRRKH